MIIAEEIFNNNKLLKLCFDDFNNFSSKNFKLSLKFLAGIKLLSDKYISVINDYAQDDITSELNNDLKEYLTNLFSALMTNEDFSTINSMSEYVCGTVSEAAQSVIIGESAPDSV